MKNFHSLNIIKDYYLIKFFIEYKENFFKNSEIHAKEYFADLQYNQASQNSEQTSRKAQTLKFGLYKKTFILAFLFINLCSSF